MKKQKTRKLALHRETLRSLDRRHLLTARGAAVEVEPQRPTGDTCLCAPTFWETCEGKIAIG